MNKERVEQALRVIGWSKSELARRLGAPTIYVVYQRLNADADLPSDTLDWLFAVEKAVKGLPAPPAWQAKPLGRPVATRKTNMKRQKAIARMRRNGVAMTDIARELGISRQWCYRLLDGAGV